MAFRKIKNNNKSNNKKIMTPLSNFIFLKYDKSKKNKEGVVLSDTSKAKPAKATVIAVGPGMLDRHGNLIKTQLKKGDTVIIDPFTPRFVKVDNEEYIVIRENEIYAKI